MTWSRALVFAFTFALIAFACGDSDEKKPAGDETETGGRATGGDYTKGGKGGDPSGGRGGLGGFGGFSGRGGSSGASGEAGAANGCGTPSGTGTIHGDEDIEQDTVWTFADSPHILNYSVRVQNGATLTIEPCSVLELAEDVSLSVGTPSPSEGTLIAEGTAEEPITIRGQDGARFGEIYVIAPATARLAYVNIENGGGEHDTTIEARGDGVPADPVLLVEHVTIRDSLGSGIWLNSAGTFIDGSTELTITESGSDVVPYPLLIQEHAIDSVPVGSYTGNQIDEIGVRAEGTRTAGEGLPVDATIHQRGVPYRMIDSFRIGGTGTLATVTIEPGVVMRFEPETFFFVQFWGDDAPASAALRAIGTEDAPIIFTSAADNPAPDDWGGVYFSAIPVPSNRLDYVTIEYAGYDCNCGHNTCSESIIESGDQDAAIYIGGPPDSAFITNAIIRDISGSGIVEGYDGPYVNLRANNDFVRVSRCEHTRPREMPCPDPAPLCD